MKGFDYLAPQGFYDACTAYGLPPAIADLDRAAQSLTRCFPRTAFGIADPILVEGVTKQGGPMSPFKATITTSLGHQYLDDLASSDPDSVVIQSSSKSLDDPHLPDDSASLRFSMAEATDDSYIVARTFPALQRFTLAMERFQFIYGLLTSWEKTTLHILNSPETPPKTLPLQSVTNIPGVDPWMITEHEVPVSTDEFSFLRTQVDDPKTRYLELADVINSFSFPAFSFRTPFTLIRKIVSQNVISRCRALLSLQPILHADAVKLDQRIMKRVHDVLGFPFCPWSAISTLPLAFGGFDFPSIARINAGVAIDGLARNLNHHIPAYKTMALITLADWTCQINGCVYPLDGEGLRRSFARFRNSIPAAWIVAQDQMSTLGLSLRQTDQSHILDGLCSISHALSLLKPSVLLPECPTGHAIRSLHSMGVRLMCHIGCWTSDGPSYTSFIVRTLPPGNWSLAQTKNWDLVKQYLIHAQIHMLYPGSADLLLSRSFRRRKAEEFIQSIVLANHFLPTIISSGSRQWGTDGSMIPSSAGALDYKSVTSAITGPRTIVMKLLGRNISILHGELIGIIGGLVLSNSEDDPTVIYTDHLNSTRLVDDSRTSANIDARLRHMNGRSYYRWILHLLGSRQAAIIYTKGHSAESSVPSILNASADYYPSQSQRICPHLPHAPIPTFFMDRFTFFTSADGWIESNVRAFTDQLLVAQCSRELGLKHGLRLTRFLYDPTPPPAYPYLRSLSCYSALVQLYSRSGQLPTASRLYSRQKSESQQCRFGCLGIPEDDHHIFVECPYFASLRLDALSDVVKFTESKCRDIVEERLLSSAVVQCLVLAAKFLFYDDSVFWPLRRSAFYLGQIPDVTLLLGLEHPTPHSSLSPSFRLFRIIHSIAMEWHVHSIRLGRIWGQV